MDHQYTILRMQENEGSNAVPEIRMNAVLWTPDWGIRAGGRILHDGKNLYVQLWAREKKIRAEYTEPMSPVHEDSCLEFFFMPDGETRYMNFEINPNGCLHLGFGKERKDRQNILPEDPAKRFGIQTKRTPEGWETAFRIPGDFLQMYYTGFDFTGVLKANVYKCGDKTEHPHYLAWHPVSTPEPDFHRPEFFGKMVFG